MFTFANYSRRFPINTTLSRYCTQSTNNSIRKLTQEMNEERKSFLVKKYFNEKNKNHDDNNDDDDDDDNNNSVIIISIASILSAFYFLHKFIYSK
jgi:hypothetical protein